MITRETEKFITSKIRNIIESSNLNKYKMRISDDLYYKVVISRDNDIYSLKLEKKNESRDTLQEWNFNVHLIEDRGSIDYSNYKNPNLEDTFNSLGENSYYNLLDKVIDIISNIIEETDSMYADTLYNDLTEA